MTFINHLNEAREDRKKGEKEYEQVESQYILYVTKAMFAAFRSVLRDYPELREFYWAQVYTQEQGFHIINQHIIGTSSTPLQNDVAELFEIFKPEEFRLVFGDQKLIRVGQRGIVIDFFDPDVP